MRVPASFRQSGRKCSYRQGDYPAGIGILEDECLSDYNYEKDQTVQDHAGIQNLPFSFLPEFPDWVLFVSLERRIALLSRDIKYILHFNIIFCT